MGGCTLEPDPEGLNPNDPLKVMGFFFFKRTNAAKSMITVKEAAVGGTQDAEYELLQV